MPYIKDASGNYLPSPTITGADGREVLLRNNGTAIQWRYSDTEWADLAYLDELAGADGREVELGLGTTHLQWHYVDDPSWTNLIALSDITGPRGYTGPANVLQIGTVQGGDNAAATITGSAPSQTLNLVLPKGDPSTVPGPTGRGIVSIDRTAGTGAPGTVDTYTITYSDNSINTFQVRNGADGQGMGDMLASIYAESSGVVKDSAKLGAQLPAYYAKASDVPSAAEKLEWSAKQAQITASGILKGAGAGSVSAAVAGTDYIAPPTLLTALPASETALQDNAEYRVDSVVGTYQFAFPASPHRIWLRITTSASPAITFPAGTKYGGGAPTWKASTEYEMTVVDGRVVVMEMVSA